MFINSHTDLYCIFGKPVRHSFSPQMHNAAFQEIKLNAVYLAFEPRSIEEAVKSMRDLDIKGASITIPFKIDVMKYIDDIDPLADDIGSVNTLHNVNGRITGYNSDGYGAVKALINNGIAVENRSFLILGNGGSARSIAYTLLKYNAKVIIAGRNSEKIKNLADDLQKKFNPVDHILFEKLDTAFMKNIDVIINTTSLGMHPDIESVPIKSELINDTHAVFDIIYSPHTTKLIQTAEEKKCKIVHGIEMLINQGVKQFEIWTGKQAPYEVMFRIVYDILTSKKV